MLLKKNDPLGLSELKERESVMKTLEFYDSLLTKRVDYIVEKNAKEFKVDFKYWCFLNARESEVGTFTHYGDFFGVEIDPKFSAKIIDKDGKIIELIQTEDGGEIPVRWLTEDFEEELEKGRLSYLAKCLEQKEKNLLKNKEEFEKEESIKESLKKKLTKDELKFLSEKIIL